MWSGSLRNYVQWESLDGTSIFPMASCLYFFKDTPVTGHAVSNDDQLVII